LATALRGVVDVATAFRAVAGFAAARGVDVAAAGFAVRRVAAAAFGSIVAGFLAAGFVADARPRVVDFVAAVEFEAGFEVLATAGAEIRGRVALTGLIASTACAAAVPTARAARRVVTAAVPAPDAVSVAILPASVATSRAA
jgi:hypothetical protein